MGFQDTALGHILKTLADFTINVGGALGHILANQGPNVFAGGLIKPIRPDNMGNMISQETGKTGIDTVGCHKGFVPVVFGHDTKCR